MQHHVQNQTRCMVHQMLEDQMSPVGLVCPRCKQRLYTRPPKGRCMSFWESQPGAYSLEGEPCFVYSLVWDDFRIRSLHPANSHEDSRAEKANNIDDMQNVLSPKYLDWVEKLLRDRGFIRDPELDLDADDAPGNFE